MWRPSERTVERPPSTPMAPVMGPEAWTGAEMAARDDWIYTLSAAEIGELEAAVAATVDRGLAIMAVGKNDFPLPGLGPRLAAVQEEILDGRGFVLFRGIDPKRYGREQVSRLYWGIGRHLGDPVSQNYKGHLLGHIRDLDLPDTPGRRPYQTTIGLHYHTDSCDIVGLMCLHPAKAGGESAIASASAVYNRLLETRPDLVEALCGSFHVDRKEEVPAGKKPWYEVSFFNFLGGRMTSVQLHHDITSAQRFAELPRLTPVQLEAMKALQTLSEDLSLKMDFQPGDMQFLHNHTVLHSRTVFEDFPEPERKRHLLRLWLSAPNGRPLPEFYRERWGTIEVGSLRGGITVPDMRPTVPLEPV